MNAFRSSSPQVEGKLFLTDGGIETTLIFLESLELPHFSAIDALRSPEGSAALWRYFQAYVTLAERIVISGCIGPRGDGYSPGAVLTERESERFTKTLTTH